LDVEGYEYEVLRGLNLIKYRPRYMIIEIYVNDYETIVSFLKTNHYKKLGNVTNFNLQDNPNWDGTHNDYLFVDSLKIKLKSTEQYKCITHV
jgi:hypothetical protein